MDPAPIRERLPDRLHRLADLAGNLWWSWQPTMRRAFRTLDYPLWQATAHNPVDMLHQIAPERLEAAAADPDYLALYDEAIAAYDRARDESLWFPEQYLNLADDDRPVAYFSAEFGIHTALPIYSGGLGVLAGDHCKEASDLGLPLVGTGFLYNEGYFRQRVPSSGWQEAIHRRFDDDRSPIQLVHDDNGEPLTIHVPLGERDVEICVWHVALGRTPLYLMDANVEGNAPWDRRLTAQLYGGDQETRIQQEVILGLGGVRLLRVLGMEPAVWHLNEGHSAFLGFERLHELLRKGHSLEEACDQVRASTVFTTHTPVPAGHDVFPFDLVEKYFRRQWQELEVDPSAMLELGSADEADGGPMFNMTALALRLSGARNAVSEIHGHVSRNMWQSIWPDRSAEDVPIGHVTNGIHTPTWVAREMDDLFQRHLDTDWIARYDDPELWRGIDNVPDKDLWDAHCHLKRKTLRRLRERTRRRWLHRDLSLDQILTAGSFLDPDALTVGFARRFATYKRADLLFRDIERIKRLLNDPYRPVQVIFAGKAHPADDAGKHLIQMITQHAQDPSFGGRIAFVEDYDMHLAHVLVQGVDVWINTPRRPNEASGTSGQKAALNGVPNFSVLDGWWAEGFNGANGWAIGGHDDAASPEEQDAQDAEALYHVLENDLIPAFYERDERDVPERWTAMMKASIRSVAPQFNTRRMLKDYVRQYYVPAAQTSKDPK